MIISLFSFSYSFMVTSLSFLLSFSSFLADADTDIGAGAVDAGACAHVCSRQSYSMSLQREIHPPLLPLPFPSHGIPVTNAHLLPIDILRSCITTPSPPGGPGGAGTSAGWTGAVPNILEDTSKRREAMLAEFQGNFVWLLKKRDNSVSDQCSMLM
jgi:hypothetical protein